MAINVLFFNGLLINWRGNRKSAHLKLLWLTAVHRNVALVLELKFIYSEKTTKFCEISPIYRFDHYYIGQIFSGDFASASCTSHTLFVQSSEHYYSALCTESKLTSQYFLIYDFFSELFDSPSFLVRHTQNLKPHNQSPQLTAQDVVIKMAEMWVNITGKSSRS